MFIATSEERMNKGFIHSVRVDVAISKILKACFGVTLSCMESKLETKPKPYIRFMRILILWTQKK